MMRKYYTTFGPERPGVFESATMKQIHRLIRRSVLVVLGILISAQAAVSEEYVFSMVFGSQSEPKQLRYTHTWVTMVRAVGEGPDLSTYNLELSTISWLPKTMDIKVLRPWGEPGVNLDLYQTLSAVLANQESITMWGPFVTRRELWGRSLYIRSILDSGLAQYRAISSPNNLLVGDCVHAVAAMDPVFGRGHYPLIRIGKPASRYMVHEIMRRSIFDQYQYNNAWLIPRLGLDRYPIEVVPPQAIAKAPCGLCTHRD
jgi:hypothetical protein